MSVEPAAGAFVATVVLCAFLAPPVLLLALTLWLLRGASESPSLRLEPGLDLEFTARFHELEEGILKPN